MKYYNLLLLLTACSGTPDSPITIVELVEPTVEASSPDAGSPEASSTEASSFDAGSPDASSFEASSPDAISLVIDAGSDAADAQCDAGIVTCNEFLNGAGQVVTDSICYNDYAVAASCSPSSECNGPFVVDGGHEGDGFGDLLLGDTAWCCPLDVCSSILRVSL
jgi:hypothetical protein